MQNLNNFLLIYDSSVTEESLFRIDDRLESNYPPVRYKGHFCFYHGIFHNNTELISLTGTSTETLEEALIELYLKNQEKFPELLFGNYSLVIGSPEKLYLLRDGNGHENIYFSVIPSGSTNLIISNSIKEIAKHRKLALNTDILPEYFIKTDVNSGATFYKDIRTLAFFEFVIINRNTLGVETGFFDSFFSRPETLRDVRIKNVIDDFDSIFAKIINTKFSQLGRDFKVINALSGGTDSSFIQYYLKKRNSDIAYTANFKNGGLDHSYATDVSALMNLNQKTVNSNTSDLINSMPDGIFLAEKPYLFAGESLLFNMYREIGKDFNIQVACFDGTGAEGILGASKILYELRIIRKYHFLFGLVLPFFKLKSEKLYLRYKEFHKYVRSRTVPDNFILRYFTDDKIRDTVKDAFGLSDLNNIDNYEILMMRKYNTILFEAVYRYLAFELEYKRVNNVRVQLAKESDITLVFPYTETELFKYLITFDTEIKLRNAKTKYIFRKAMSKYFPASIVYRKKIKKNVSVSDEILQNEKTKEIIEEIKNRHYPYFKFNYELVFSSPKYASIAYKLINFHIWHRLFIDGDMTSSKAN